MSEETIPKRVYLAIKKQRDSLAERAVLIRRARIVAEDRATKAEAQRDYYKEIADAAENLFRLVHAEVDPLCGCEGED